MVGADASFLFAGALIIAALGALLRLWSLRLLSVYPAISSFLIFQIVVTVASNLTGLQTGIYAVVYVVLVIFEWLVYGFLVKEIYNSVFSGYPGIAVLGRWSIYGAVSAASLVCFVSVLAEHRFLQEPRVILLAFEIAAHCLTLGFAFLVLLILFVIARYPIQLHRNIIINCFIFGTVLILEATVIITDQLTHRHSTAAVNLAGSISTVICLALWSLLLSREGQVHVMKLRTNVSELDEARLLGQLGALNSILIRSVRH